MGRAPRAPWRTQALPAGAAQARVALICGSRCSRNIRTSRNSRPPWASSRPSSLLCTTARIRYIETGSANVVFVLPVRHLVAVCRTGEPVEHVWQQLALHSQIISILTAHRQIFQKNAAYDVAPPGRHRPRASLFDPVRVSRSVDDAPPRTVPPDRRRRGNLPASLRPPTCSSASCSPTLPRHPAAPKADARRTCCS